MRWKTMIIVVSAAAALVVGLGARPTVQRPVLHALIAPVIGG